MSGAEELAMRVAVDLVSAEHPADMTKSILAALHEYGQAVRDRDAEIARNMGHDDAGMDIEREPLP